MNPVSDPTARGPGGLDGATEPASNLASRPTTTQAAVLSGGGARGAYEIGVLKALIEGSSPASNYQPVELDVFSGTSVGAYNASFMATHGGGSELQAIQALEAIWTERIANTRTSCGNGVFRIRGAPFQFFDPGCLLHPVRHGLRLLQDASVLARSFAAHGAKFLVSDETLQVRLLQSIDVSSFFSEAPLDALIADTIDLKALASSGRELRIVASNWQLGKAVTFTGSELVYRYGDRPILASTALPGLFPPVVIDGIPFVDGGTTMNTPLKPAIDAGADVLHVIFVDPRVNDVPIPVLPSTLDTVYRLYLILVADKFNVDIGTIAMVNDAIRVLGAGLTSDLLRSPGNPLSEASPFLRALIRLETGGSDSYRPLEVHKYRPKTTDKGGEDLLDFRSDNIHKLIAEGYADTVAHDCDSAGCLVLAPETRPTFNSQAQEAVRR